MIDIEYSGGVLRVADAEKNEVSILNTGHVNQIKTDTIDRLVDMCLIGQSSRLIFPAAGINLSYQENDQWLPLTIDDVPITLKERGYLLQIEAAINIYISFDCSAKLDTSSGQIVLDLSDTSDYVLGFRSRARYSTHSITVPPEIDPIAKAITHLTSNIRSNSPDRSYPSVRGAPPTITLGDELFIPDVIKKSTIRNRIQLRLPRDLRYVYIASPLVYYLGADIELHNDFEPDLYLHEYDYSYRLGFLPEFETRVSECLRMCFYLDCVVRNGGPHGVEMPVTNSLQKLNIDFETVYQSTPSERLMTYFQLPYDKYRALFPEWFHSTYIDPIISNVDFVPYVLDYMSTIHLPNGSQMTEQQRTSERLYSADSDQIERFQASLCSSQFHAWVANGAPVGVFKPTIASYKNRSKYVDSDFLGKNVLVVVNDRDMRSEAKTTYSMYADKAETVSMETKMEYDVSRNELSSLLEDGFDFLHLIGHANERGIKCSDGYLDIKDINLSNVRVFFFNSCRSYEQGVAMLEKGSVAGVITTRDVFNEPATIIGSTLARLLVQGFALEPALQLAKRRTAVDPGYLVIGDGSHSIVQGEQVRPLVAEMAAPEDQPVTVDIDVVSPRSVGSCYALHGVPGVDPTPRLTGQTTHAEMDRGQFRAFLEEFEGPIIRDGSLWWPAELRGEDGEKNTRSNTQN